MIATGTIRLRNVACSGQRRSIGPWSLQRRAVTEARVEIWHAQSQKRSGEGQTVHANLGLPWMSAPKGATVEQEVGVPIFRRDLYQREATVNLQPLFGTRVLVLILNRPTM